MVGLAAAVVPPSALNDRSTVTSSPLHSKASVDKQASSAADCGSDGAGCAPDAPFNVPVPYCQKQIVVSDQMRALGAYDILAQFHALSDCSMCSDFLKSLADVVEDCTEYKEKKDRILEARDLARQKTAPGGNRTEAATMELDDAEKALILSKSQVRRATRSEYERLPFRVARWLLVTVR